jgi:hypothetical protein
MFGDVFRAGSALQQDWCRTRLTRDEWRHYRVVTLHSESGLSAK